jgi:hypothetical protein
MAPDERDRSFDKALAHHLRSAAPADEAAGIPGVSSLPSGVCPDPETLAAYHERSLLSEQLNSLKEHIAGCANCQTVLAHLEMTDEIPLQAAEEEQVFAHSAAAPTMPASHQTQAPSPEALARKSRRARLLRGARWQWLAPAGAIAAGLLVWVALHENQGLPLPTLPANENKVAQNRFPSAPTPSVSAPSPQSSASAKPTVALSRPQAQLNEPTISNGRVASDDTKQSQTLRAAAGTRSADSQTDEEFRARKDGARDQLSAAKHADLDAKRLPDALRKKEAAPAEAEKLQAELTQLQNSQTQNQNNNYVSPKVPGPSPLNQMESSRKAKSTAAAAPAPSAPPQRPGAVGGVASNYNDTTSLKLAREISNPRLISPPGSNAIWRAGRSGLIEFSKDGGSSWSRQTSGVLADLLAGSAPSDQVCWIVGRVGAVLLTTDGGAHWKVVPSPLPEDLGGIHASDALHATIWNARSAKSFETSDGGLTWKPIPSP